MSHIELLARHKRRAQRSRTKLLESVDRIMQIYDGEESWGYFLQAESEALSALRGLLECSPGRKKEKR